MLLVKATKMQLSIFGQSKRSMVITKQKCVGLEFAEVKTANILTVLLSVIQLSDAKNVPSTIALKST